MQPKEALSVHSLSSALKTLVVATRGGDLHNKQGDSPAAQRQRLRLGHMQSMERDTLKQYLDTYFDTSEETQPVSLSDLTKFFEAAGKYHKLSGFQPSAVAKTMVEHGLTTTHGVGRLQRRDLQDMGMLMGHAMVLVQHLGERSMDTPGTYYPYNYRVRYNLQTTQCHTTS